MFDGQKIEPGAPDQVENDVIIHDKLAEVISFAHHTFKTLEQRLGFQRPDDMGKEGTARLRKATKGRDDIVKEAVQKASEGGPAVGFQK